MKRIGVAIRWPRGQGDFNIGIIERGICRFSPGPLPSSLSLLSTARMKTNAFSFSMQSSKSDTCKVTVVDSNLKNTPKKESQLTLNLFNTEV